MVTFLCMYSQNIVLKNSSHVSMTEGYSFFFSLFSRKIVETFEVRYCSVPLLIFMHLCLVSAGQAISEPGTDHLDDAGRGPGPGSASC